MTAIADVLALSPLQEGLFAIAGTRDGAIYTMQFVADITGPLDARILRRSLDTMLRRHPNLGVSFWAEGLPKPVQIVPVDAAIPWRQVYGRLGNASEIARRERETPFDISHGPLLRAVLAGFTDQADRHRLILTAHHIVLDGWSMAVFARELFAIYSAGGQDHSLPAPPRYRDYIAWLAGRDDRATGRAWAGYLSALSGPLLLAETGPAAIRARPARFRHSLSNAATENLRAWAKAQGLTLNTVAAFAWSVVLSRLTGRTDVVFGTTVSGRPPGLAGVESMTGLFINTVPVATEAGLTGTVAGQCHRLQRDCAAMRAHEHHSLSAIQRAAGCGTLFDTLFVFENAPIGSATEVVTTADGVSFTPLTMESLAHYPLTVVAYLADDRLVILLEATPAAFPDIRMDDIGARLTMLLDCLPAHADTAPGWLPVALPGDAAVVSPPAGALPEDGVGARFLSQAARTPSALALWADGVNYTYRELAELVSRAAAGLRHYGIGPEHPVALVMERSADTVVAILAVLVAGGCYVPLDPALPRPRIRSMLRQSRASLVVASGTDQPDLGVRSVTMGQLQSHGQFPPGSASPAGRAAYVIFTSGSTGEPKGVTGTHGAILSYFADHRCRVYAPAVSRLGRTLRIAHAWTFSFDASWQPLAGLLDGHSLHLVNDDDMRDAGQLVKTIAAQSIDMIDTTPSMYAQLEAAGLRPGALAVLALGGEPIPVSRWDELRALPATAVYNCYGPTETTVEAMIATVNPGTGQDETGPGQVTIGEPAAGMSVTLLDAALRPVPQGVAGELYLAGPQLTRGYAGQPGLTVTAFIADPGGRGQRMYRTGDMARRLINGRISFLGRADSQVKIRGYRIEISEIETALAAQDGVAAAAVIARPGPTGKVLIAFAAGSCIDTRAVRAGLLRRIPGYMLPSRLHAIAALPLTSNGKIDVTQLHQLDDSLPPSGNPVGQAATSTERILCAALTSLGAVAAGPETELDSLGLDSIAAIALVNQLRQQGLTVTPHMVLTYPAVSDLAAAIDTQPDRRLAAEPASGPVPPLPIVQWLQEYGNYRRFTQTVLIALPPDIFLDGLRSVLQEVLDTHAMLRARLGPAGEISAQPPGTVSARQCLTESIVHGDLAGELSAHARDAIEQIDPAAGKLLRAVWLRRDSEPDVLLMTVHHLATDVVSWHIIFAALAAAWERLASGRGAPNPEITGYREWCQRLTARASAPEVGVQQQYWEAQLAGADPPLGWRYPEPDTDTWASLRETVIATPAGLTGAVISALAPARGSGAPSVREFLLAALVLTLRTWRARRGVGAPEVLIALEGHGREDDVLGTDTSATVGWFTTVYPQRFTAGAGSLDAVVQEPALARELVNAVTAQMNTLPNRGLDFGVLKYLRGGPALRTREPQVEFNYLGRFDLSTAGRAAAPGPWAPLVDQRLNSQLPVAPEPQLPLRYALDVSAAIGAGDAGPVLSTGWRWSTALFAESDIAALTEIWSAAIEVLAQGLQLRRGSDDNTAHRALS